MKQKLLTGACLTAMIACAFMPQAHANPTDGTVTAGNASITASGKTLDITQYSDKAIIDWRGFDIDADETTNFIQPNSGSITLNRVHSSQASTINGRLNANGNIIIINQNGIIFGNNAQVDVHGLVATTSDVDNNDFMQSSRVHFNLPGNTSASIINNGTITAHDAGLVGFVAPNVENNGIITANLGRVHLASGDKATVDFYGDGLMEVEVSDNVQSQIVTNTGSITADGGKIALTAAAGGQIVHSIINAQGSMRAQSVGVHNGQIVIGGAGAHRTNKTGRAVVNVAGNLDASGRSAGSKGGAITITGDDIVLASTAHLDSSGDLGGGVIKIGGDYHGQGSLQTAANLTVHGGAIILNDALTAGDGGDTTLWSDLVTYFKGFIGARGGNTSGKGGFVEVSGRDFLHYDGLVDLSAKNEDDYGTLLLDPTDITISSAADSGGSFAGGVYTPSGATSVINTTTLAGQLAAANVTISTASAFGGNGDITVANALSFTAGKNLTLTADRDITVNAAIAAGVSGNTAITMTAGRDIAINANVNGNGTGIITMTATRNLTTAVGTTITSGVAGGLVLRAANAVITNQGLLTINGTLSTGSGVFTLLNGLDIGGATRTNDLTLTNANLLFNNTNASVTTITGFRDINLNGNFVGSNNVTVTAERNLTIGAGATISSGTTGALALRAAGGVITNVGLLTINGTLNNGTGVLTLLNGLDANGTTRTNDLTLTTGNLTLQGANVGAITITGFRDTTLNRALSSTGAITITADRDLTIGGLLSETVAVAVALTSTTRDVIFNAGFTHASTVGTTVTAFRNLTINSGATITAAASSPLALRAANNVITNNGILTLDGSINLGTSATLTLLTGLDLSGTRTVDLTLNTSNLTFSGGAIGATTITGFRDITIDQNLNTVGSVSITAERNLTLNATRTVTSTGTLTFRAAGGVTTNIGVLTLNGNLTNGSGNVVLLNGLDANGTTRTGDLTLSNTTLTVSGATLGTLTITGFRDVTLNKTFAATGSTITAERNLAIASGTTFSSGSTTATVLRAGGATSTNIGLLTISGTLDQGVSGLTLANGLDSDGINRTNDLTLTTSNLTLQGANVGAITITGYRDNVFARNITSTGNFLATAERNLTINAGATINSSGSGFATIRAAGGSTGGTGILTINGTLGIGTGNSTLTSGLDGSGNRADLTLTTSNFSQLGGAIGGTVFQGFRDLTISRNLTIGGNTTLTAVRNFTLSTGATLSTNAGFTLTLNAANGSTSNIGILTIDGNLAMGTSTLTLLSGLDASSARTADLTIGTGNFTYGGVAVGALNISGYRDIIVNRDITGNNAVTLSASRDIAVNGVITGGSNSAITLTAGNDMTVAANITAVGSGTPLLAAVRNLTINAGATVASGTTGGVVLRAANNVVTNTGLLTINGAISTGTGAFGLTSGVDGSGNRLDLALSSSNLTANNTSLGAVTISGYRDIALNSSYTMNGAASVTAMRNLTIGTGAIITTGAATALTLLAANNVSTNTGIFTLNGTINMGTGVLTLMNGLDADGINRTNDLTFTTSNLTFLGASIGAPAWSGFRDVNLNRSITFGAVTSITADRNFTIGAGATIASGGATSLTMRAANNNTVGLGLFTNNGTISIGTSTLTLVSGVDGSGNRADLTLDNSSLTFQGAATGGPTFSGFRDINLNRNISFNTAATITAVRSVTIGAGATINSAAAAALTLNAAGGNVANNGLLTINGVINMGTAALILRGGVDPAQGAGIRGDLTLTNANLTRQGASIGALTIAGYRDINLNGNIISSGAIDVTADRHLTVGAGATITPGSASALSLKAASNLTTVLGSFTLNGTLNLGTGTLLLNSGQDGSGILSTDLTLNSSNITFQGAAIGTPTITGFRDINLNRSITFNSTAGITANRHLTIGSGAVISSGAANAFTLAAAGGVITNTGIFTNNGTINAGTATLTLTSGLDGSGNRTDLTVDGTNLTLQGATLGTPTWTGFRDITINRSIPFGATVTLTAVRDLTIGVGATISAASTNISLLAANNAITNQGRLILNGAITMGTGQLTLLTGLDLSGLRTIDLTLNSSNFSQTGNTGVTSITGFRDITLATNFTGSNNITVAAQRNLTINSGVTIASGSANSLSLSAAGAVTTNTGVFVNNGTISNGNGTLVIYSGVDGSGNRVDLTLDNASFIQQGTSVGAASLNGFRDINFNKNIAFNGNVNITAVRNITIGAGATVSAGAANNLILAAANGAATNSGVLTLNGTVSMGTGALTLTSGLDGSSALTDITLTTSNLTFQGAAMAGMTLTGFRDINLNRSITFTAATTVQANRNLTIGAGATIASGAATTLTLNAAAGNIANTGIFTLNGIVSTGSANLSFLSGFDGSGNRADLTITNANLTLQGATMGSPNWTGFRDVTFSRNIAFGNTVSLTAQRDINISAGVTLTAGASSNFGLLAANNLRTVQGQVNLNGTINMGSGIFTLAGGTDGTSITKDLTIDNTNLTYQGASIGGTVLVGFRDITLSKNITSTGTNTITAERHLTIGSGVTVAGTINTLRAAGGTATNSGLLNLNGTISQGTGLLTLVSGLDGSGNLQDITFTTSNLTFQGADFGGLGLAGYRDVTFNRNMTFNAVNTTTAVRNMTIGAGVTIASGASTNLTLNAGNAVIGNNGGFYNNGVISMGTGNLNILSGTDTTTGRPNYTVTNTNLVLQGATIGALGLNGFSDITINKSLTFTGSIGISAQRDITIASGVTLTGTGSASFALNAAGTAISNNGLVNLNGTVSLGTGTFTLLSGFDGAGGRGDLLLDSSHINLSGASIGTTSITGFRDVTIDRNITATGSVTITAQRNLTLTAGNTLTTTGASGLTLASAAAVATNTGVLNLNGAINVGSGALTLSSGVDGSGNRVDLTLDNAHYTQGATIGVLTITGFRDIFLNKNITSSSNVIVTAYRDLTLASGATISPAAAGNLTLQSAGGVTTGTGVLNINGVITAGTSALTLKSGLDSSGNAVDLTIDNSHFTLPGSMLTFSIAGFRDTVVGMNLTSVASLGITATRHLTVNSGVTIQTTTTGGMSLMAANGVATNTGLLTINGMLLNGTSGITLLSGKNNAGTGGTFTVSNAILGYVPGNTTFGNITLTAWDLVTVDPLKGTTLTLTGGHNTTVGDLTFSTALGLRAANNTITGNGIITVNGLLTGQGPVTFRSGIGDDGNRADFTISNSNFAYNSGITNFGTFDIQGFRDLTVSCNLASTNFALIVYRDLNIDATLTGVGSGATYLTATLGHLNFLSNGRIDQQSLGLITLSSGADSAGNRVDLTLDDSNFNVLPTMGGLVINGFRDINFNKTVLAGDVNITAERNLTQGAGTSIGSIAGKTIALRAGGGAALSTTTGVLTLNGTLNLNSTWLTLSTGLDSNGDRPDLIWNNAKYNTANNPLSWIVLSGYRDITLNNDITTFSKVDIVAQRNLTLPAGITVTAGPTANTTFNSGGGVMTNVGYMDLSGRLNVGTGSLTLISGMDSAGNRQDFVWDNATHLTTQGATVMGYTINGFRDITVAANISSTQYTGFMADRNLTINNGVTVHTNSGNSTTLNAAGGDGARSGVFINNGLVELGTIGLTITSGLDSGGHYSNDLIFDNTRYVMQGATINGANISGFRDIYINQNITSTSTVTLKAGRNLTIPAGITVSSSASTGVSLLAAFADSTGATQGQLFLLGTINTGTGNSVFRAGVDSSGNFGDLVFNSSNYNYLSTGTNYLNIAGFRDITFARNMATGSYIQAIAQRDIILNAGVTLTTGAGNNLVLVAGNYFKNNGGTLSPGGYWNIYQMDNNGPAVGVAYTSRIFDCAFTSACGGSLGIYGNYLYYANAASFDPSDPETFGQLTLPASVVQTSQNPYSNHTATPNMGPTTSRTTSSDGITFTTTASQPSLFGLPGNAFLSPDDITLTFAPELVEKYGLHDWNF